jgi:hypothetical protein
MRFAVRSGAPRFSSIEKIMSDSLFNDLIEQITKGQVVAVVGAGVSLATTGGAEAAGWTGLLRLGIQRCADAAQPRPASGWADRQRSALDGDLADLLSVADQVSDRLGGYRKTSA